MGQNKVDQQRIFTKPYARQILLRAMTVTAKGVRKEEVLGVQTPPPPIGLFLALI